MQSRSNSEPCAEEVEVPGVRVLLVEESIAGGSRPRPAVVEPGQASLVVRRLPLRPSPSGDDAAVSDNEADEADQGHEDQGGRDQALPGEPGQHEPHHELGQPRVGEGIVATGESAGEGPTRVEPSPILSSGVEPIRPRFRLS